MGSELGKAGEMVAGVKVNTARSQVGSLEFWESTEKKGAADFSLRSGLWGGLLTPIIRFTLLVAPLSLSSCVPH